jgi:hypothetical protein
MILSLMPWSSCLNQTIRETVSTLCVQTPSTWLNGPWCTMGHQIMCDNAQCPLLRAFIHISVWQMSDLHWVQKLRGYLTATAAEMVTACSGSTVGQRGTQAPYQCVNWSQFWCYSPWSLQDGATQGVVNSDFSCVEPVRWCIPAHNTPWTCPHQTWDSLSVKWWQGIHCTL